MSEITVNIKTLKQEVFPLKISATATLGELKELATNTLNLGSASTCVFKGSPLKQDDATLQSIGINDNDAIVTVFKKAKPAVVAPPAASELPAVTPAVAPAAVAAPVVPDVEAPAAPVDWECGMCTYFNIAARSVCEMCETPNPARPVSRAPVRAPVANNNAAVSNMMAGADLDGVDQATLLAIQNAMAEDMNDGDEGDAMRMEMDLEQMIQVAETDPAARSQIMASFGLPEDASIEQLRTAVMEQSVVGAHDNAQDSQALLSYIMHDPAAQAQLHAALSGQGNMDPDQLRQTLLALFQQAGGEVIDEDDEDFEMDDDDMGADQW